MTTDLYPKVRRPGGGRRQHRGHRQGRGHGRARHGHHAGLSADRPAGAARRPAPPAGGGGRPQLQPHQRRQRHQHLRHRGAAVVGRQSPAPTRRAFAAALDTVCADLAEDVVRNGEGVHHVIRVEVRGAPSEPVARAVGKGVVNSPLVKTAICGNDPNVGRIAAALGKQIARHAPGLDLSRLRLRLGGHDLYHRGAFRPRPRQRSRPGRPPDATPSCTPASLPPTACSNPRSTTPRTNARSSSRSTWAPEPQRRPCWAPISATSTSARTPTTAANGERRRCTVNRSPLTCDVVVVVDRWLADVLPATATWSASRMRQHSGFERRPRSERGSNHVETSPTHDHGHCPRQRRGDRGRDVNAHARVTSGRT